MNQIQMLISKLENLEQSSSQQVAGAIKGIKEAYRQFGEEPPEQGTLSNKDYLRGMILFLKEQSSR